MKEQREREFAEAPVRSRRTPAPAYPEERDELRETMNGWMSGATDEQLRRAAAI